MTPSFADSVEHRTRAFLSTKSMVVLRSRPGRTPGASRLSVQSADERRLRFSDTPRYELMSSTNDSDLTAEQIDRKLEVMGQTLPDARVEALREKRAELAGDSEDGADLVEALQQYDEETLDDAEALQAEIEQRQEKLALVESALPESRLDEIRGEIEALRAAKSAHGRFRINTAERLAKRAEVSDE
jgi:SMC interacting uncharacterized protein involved in chromosome segregation